MTKRPLFIVIEGIDGSGKSTQIELLKNQFQKRGQKAVETNEPTDGPIGSMIRNVMRGRMDADPATLAALFAADRLDHIQNDTNGMRKRMTEGYNIICSRYYFSNYAFQGEYVPIEWLVELNSQAKKILKPDVIFYLNVDPMVCTKRIAEGRAETELYENFDKLNSTHLAFLKYFDELGSDENIHIVDGSQSVSEISSEIWGVAEQLFSELAKN